MKRLLKKLIKKPFNLFGLDIVNLKAITYLRKQIQPATVKDVFHSYSYLRKNQRTQEHLATLGLDIAGSSVLEVGAGIGDQTDFFLDRGCRVVTSDVRDENVAILTSRFPELTVVRLDLEDPPGTMTEIFDIVYCYDVMLHIKNQDNAIAFMARHCRKMLLLMACVSFGDQALLKPHRQDASIPTESASGMGYMPTRRWFYDQLTRYFDYVYLPVTQPNHEDYPLDWSSPKSHPSPWARAVFVASRQKIDNDLLTVAIPTKQKRAY